MSDIIKTLDYYQYDKYINQEYIKNRKDVFIIATFLFICSSYIFWGLLPSSHTYFSMFLCINGFYFSLANFFYKYYYDQAILRFFFFDDKIAIKLSDTKYTYINDIIFAKKDIKTIWFHEYIIFQKFYPSIFIIANGKKYFIPYNNEYKDELVFMLEKYILK